MKFILEFREPGSDRVEQSPFWARSEGAAVMVAESHLRTLENQQHTKLEAVGFRRARRRPPPTRVRGVPLATGVYEFEWGEHGAVVHRKNHRRSKDAVVPFHAIATGGGVCFQIDGRSFQAALDEKGLCIRESVPRARAKHVGWKKLAWLADVAMEEPEQLAWTKLFDGGAQ